MSKASAYFKVNDTHGKHGEKELKHEIGALKGVLSVSVSDESGSVAVDFDTTGAETDRIQAEIEKLGYEVLDVRLENHVM
jgi:copper chaperone CopZ